MTEHSVDALVTADWVEDHLEEFQADDPEYRLVEINNPTVTADSEYTPYEDGHIPGATFFHWEEDLSDPVARDILDKESFETLNGEAGITEDSTVVLYGGGRVPNWFALFGYWEYKYFGHEDVRVIDGGKTYWVENDYPLTTEVPEFTPREYTARGPFENIRAYKSDVEQAIDSGVPLVDVRSPEEFTGEVIAPEGLQETAQRGGHIPGARNVPTTSVLNDDGTFKSPDELRALYEEVGIGEDQSVITYCRVGERSSIEWYVLHELLGFDDVENYDGSWTEWGNTIRAPIETGESKQ
ncbi:sulfurtransferase [Halapricum desulfuricans]|uniref:Sulfurtransferase n=1 Tax=Halapricum desulfuricans TaxID=2841257 RepID=A0A897MZN2_9EURY|nr:sulfurtransferase [Halapricum desulfuricans]QSG06112.1 Rhodanese-related sulfurtransferase [Halapricum desulfuricans]